MANGNNDNDNKRDMTRIEDLSEFLHVEDSEVDDRFDNALPPAIPEPTIVSDDLFSNELTDDISAPSESEISFSDNTEDVLDDSPFELTEDFEEVEEEKPIDFESTLNESIDEPIEDNVYDSQSFKLDALDEPIEVEKLDEIKTFAQNFSYGQTDGGGNPPFSVVIRNIKYEEDAEDILILLRELGIITSTNEDETKRALEMGSLLVPQISEYCAIILAHKLRRFNCDIELGLSDEVHPSKSGETNPRGLLKKESIRQNTSSHYRKAENNITAEEIIVSTTASLQGYNVLKYIGVQTSFAVIDEEELERLKHVQSTIRSHSTIQNYEIDDVITDEKTFTDYKNSFDLLFSDLLDQLKTKAIKENSNALLGLNYQLTSLPFEKSANGYASFQLTCSATLAMVQEL